MTVHEAVAKMKKGLRRHYFTFAMETAWSAYRVARDSLKARRDGAEQEVRTQWGLGPNDPVPEYDDETGHAPDFGDQVWELARSADDALDELRRAFLIVIFHTFERRVLRAMGTDKFVRAKVVAFLAEAGFAPDDAAIRLLAAAANAAKHAPGDSLATLKKLRPSMVDEDDEVVVSETDLDTLTKCVRHIPVAR